MPRSVLRDRNQKAAVTNMELFFDLVYVFAVTQMSQHLIGDGRATWGAALQTAILLGLVWQAWVYTTWVTNWLDPDHDAVRLLLVGLMLCALVMSASLPDAFGRWGWVVGLAFAVMHIARGAVVVVLVRGTQHFDNFRRILAWCTVSGSVAIAGGLMHGHAREVLWLAVIAIDVTGGVAGFYTPGLGRSYSTAEWVTVDGGHFAERCQAFVLIALGESLVIIGVSLATQFEHAHVPGTRIVAFVGSFLGAVALWWVYFDRSGPAGAERVAGSDDPARLASRAYHFVHPLIVAGVIVTAASDELVYRHPDAPAHGPIVWTVCGGTALFLLGHGLFTWIVWREVPWTRLAGVAALAVLGVAGTHLAALTVGIVTGLIIVAVCVADRVVFADVYAQPVTR